MRSNTARVVPFVSPKHEKFTAEELHLPRLPKGLDEVMRQVKPLFTEWMLAEGTFEHNTMEVAKAVSAAWDAYKAEEPEGTKIRFVRYFDTEIPEDAKGRDLAGNATYNHIQYLLHKVSPGPSSVTSISRQERMEKREKEIRSEWRKFTKQAHLDAAELTGVRGLVGRLLEMFMPTESVEKLLM